MTRQQEKERLFEILKEISACNRKNDLSFEITEYEGHLALFLTGKVQGRSLKLPYDHWRFSKKGGGTIVGPELLVKYCKHWRYEMGW